MCQLAHSATINVPGDQATIAAAVTAASDGDMITVNAGTYAVVVDLSKAVTLRLLGAVTVNSFTGLNTSSIDLQGNTLVTTDATNFAYPGQIIGSGGITKGGAGSMTLSGNNAYSGPTTLNGGTIVAGSNNALGTSTLTINTTANRLIVSSGITIPNNINLNSPAGTTGRGAIEGPATGTGTITGTVTIVGSTTSGGHFHGGTDGTTTNTTNPSLVFNGAITSNVTFNQRDGIITYNGGGTYNGFSFTGTANVGTGGLSSTAVVTLGVSGGATLNINGAQTLAGLTFGPNTTSVATGANTLTLNGDVTQSNNNGATISGNLNLGGGTRTFTIAQSTTTVSAVISNGGIVKEGASVLVLSGNNSFAGGVLVNNGRVTVGGTNALGSGTTTLNPGALQLLFSTTETVSNPIVVNGVQTNNHAIQGPATPLVATLAGSITINGTIGGTGGHFHGGHNTTNGGLNITGAITASVPIVQAVANTNVVYSGGGTYTSLVVTQGTAIVGATNGISPSATVTLANTGNATLTVNANQSLAGLVLGNSTGGAVGGAGTVTIATSMTMTLTGDVTSHADFAHAINQPGTLELGALRNFTVNEGAQINDLTINAIVSGTTLVKSGAGQLSLRTSTNTYTGGTRIMAGTLSIDNDVRLGAVPGIVTAGHVQINDTATLDTTASVTLATNRGIAIGNVSGTGTGTSTIAIATATTLTYAGNIANNSGSTGNLVLRNQGTLQLNAMNSYSGTTTVHEARLRLLGNTGTILNTTGIVINNLGVLDVEGTAGGNPDRIGNGVPVTLNSSILNFTTAAGEARSESIGLLTVTGSSQIVITSNTTGDARLTANDIAVTGSLALYRLQADGVSAEIGNLFSNATADTTAFATTTVIQGAAFFPTAVYSTPGEGLIGSGTSQSVFISRASTDWTVAGTWTPPGVGLDADGIPDSDDIVIIRNGDNVVVTAAPCAAKGIIFNSPGTGNGTISGTNTLTVGNSGIVVNAISAPTPTISCNLSFGGGNASITNNSTNQLTLGAAAAGNITNIGILTFNGRGQTQIELGASNANANAMKAGTFATDLRVTESAKLRIRLPITVTTQEDYLQKYTFTDGNLLDRTFNVSRGSGSVTGLINFTNVHVTNGALLSVQEDNINVRMSVALEGNATVTQANANSSDIEFYDITNSTGTPYTLTMTGGSFQNLDTVLFGNVGTNVTLDLVRCNMDFGTNATTAGQVITGTVRLATTGLGTLDIFTGRLGTNLVTGAGKFVIGGGRTIRGLVQEVGSGTRAVNDIQVKVEVPAGQSARLQTERNNDDTLNGWVRFNVEPQAGASIDVAGIGNASRLLANFNMVAAATFTNSNNSTEVFVGNVTGSAPLTIAGANQTRIIGALGPNTQVISTATSVLELTDRITELTASNFASMAVTSKITLDPTGTGALYITIGNAGVNCIAGGTVEVLANRTIRGIAAEVGSGTRALNTIDALFQVGAGLTPLFETERNNDSTLEGWVRYSRVEVGAGATINTNLNNVTRMAIDMTLLGNANYVNSDDSNGMFIGHVNGTGDLTVSGTANTRFIGALSSNANVVITNTGTSVLQDSTTELTVQRVFSFGGRSVTSATNGVLILRRDGGAGTINLPTGNTGELRIEAGRDGATDMVAAATVINTDGRNIRTFIDEHPTLANVNTVSATINVTGTVQLISERGTNDVVNGTALYTNVHPVDSATVTLARANEQKTLADVYGTSPLGATLTTNDATNARLRNALGLPTDRLIIGGTNAISIQGTTTATLGVNTSAVLTINKASPTFVATTGVFPGLYFNGGTITFTGVAGADMVETVGDVVINAGTTNILTLTPNATSDVRVTAATLTAPVGTSLRYNRTVAAPNTANFFITGATNGTVFTNVHINGTTGGSFNSTALEAGFATGLTTIQPINNFLITGPASVQIGETANFTVTARDASNATVPSYTGTVSFSITNPAQITMTQNPYTYVGAAGPGGDAGVHTFAVRFDSGAGATQALAVSDGTRFAAILVQINRGQPTISWPNATITYGDQLNGTVLNAVALNLSGNAVPGSYVYNPGAGTALNAGPNQPASVTFVPADISNYDGANGTTQITVQPRPLTITPDNTTRTYGSPNAPTATFTGFANGDDSGDLSGLTFTTAATQASVPGVYNVTASGATNPNYSVSYTGNPATLTVNPAPLTVTANTLIARINLPIPALTLSYSGFVLGQDTSVLETQAVLTTTAVQGNPLGDYPITFTTTPLDADGNYTITTVNGIMHIYPLQALVDDKTLSAGTGIAAPVALTGTSFSVNALTFSIATQPAHGAVTIVGNNAIYTSFPGYTGPDSFTYRGFDGFDFSLPGTVTVTVKPAPTITSQPTFQPNPAIAGEPLTATAATDNGSISWNFGDGSASVSGGSVSHTYAAPGLYTAVVTITSPEGLVTTKTVSVFVGFDLAGGLGAVNPPGVNGILVGGTGAGKAEGGTGKISCNYVRREKTYYQGSLGKLAIPNTLTQDMLTNLPGVLTIGSGANTSLFQFSLAKTGKGKSTGLPTIEFSIKKKAFKFKAQREDLTTLTEVLGGPRQEGVKKGEIVTLLIPVTLQIGDKVFLAMTFQVKYQQISAGGKGSL